MCVLRRTLSQKPLKPFLGQYKTKKPMEKLILEKNHIISVIRSQINSRYMGDFSF